MAQALSEQIFEWQADAWPPRSVLSGSASFEVEGTVLRHYPLNIRRAKEQQGYLKSALSADVNVKFRALELQVTSAKNLATNASIPASDLPRVLAEFASLASGPQSAPTASAQPLCPGTSSMPHLYPGALGLITIWCDSGLLADLSSRADGKPVELNRALVRITTDGSTHMARSVDLLKQAEENKTKTSLNDQPNLFAQVQSKFNPAAAAAIGGGSAAKSTKDDDEWED